MQSEYMKSEQVCQMKEFSVQHSIIAKGIAILLLILCHVLNGMYSYITIIPGNVMAELVSAGRICVGIFFILSGYGLYKSYYKEDRTVKESLYFIAIDIQVS